MSRLRLFLQNAYVEIYKIVKAEYQHLVNATNFYLHQFVKGIKTH